jgi:hypothetical protein
MSVSLRHRPWAVIALGVAASVALALAHVWVHLRVIEAGYALSRQSKLHHELADQNQKLRLELDVRRSPKSIDERARRELHMAPPDPALIRVITVAPSGNPS